ncbi:hypothetical protein TNCV_3576531 [Trichonephila clavipes]|nr:hypothetical protein TNCV_3576531 [Trichonephila clavipes]
MIGEKPGMLRRKSAFKHQGQGKEMLRKSIKLEKMFQKAIDKPTTPPSRHGRKEVERKVKIPPKSVEGVSSPLVERWRERSEMREV